MEIRETALPGVYLIVPTPIVDPRGFFARTWCQETFARHGLTATWVQSSISFNRKAGTLRGLHYQIAPAEETKLVRCTRGAIWDVLLDIRPGRTLGRWISMELSADNGHALYVTGGIAHGFQTLKDDSEVCYEISAPYHAELQRGVRWDDPSHGIVWPHCEERIIAERDNQFPNWQFVGNKTCVGRD
jgi:dTDP-4-dehydrorhamnose 3,5-epimerase